jgi:hypothetical protein
VETHGFLTTQEGESTPLLNELTAVRSGDSSGCRCAIRRGSSFHNTPSNLSSPVNTRRVITVSIELRVAMVKRKHRGKRTAQELQETRKDSLSSNIDKITMEWTFVGPRRRKGGGRGGIQEHHNDASIGTFPLGRQRSPKRRSRRDRRR